MMEAGVALVAVLVIFGVMWWRDARWHSGWDDLLSPDMRETQDWMARLFAAQERVAAWSRDQEFVAELVPTRLALVRRLAVYERIIAAAAPPPERIRRRLRFLRRAFVVLTRPRDGAAEDLAELDREALESCRVLAAAANRLSPIPSK